MNCKYKAAIIALFSTMPSTLVFCTKSGEIGKISKIAYPQGGLRDELKNHTVIWKPSRALAQHLGGEGPCNNDPNDPRCQEEVPDIKTDSTESTNTSATTIPATLASTTSTTAPVTTSESALAQTTSTTATSPVTTSESALAQPITTPTASSSNTPATQSSSTVPITTTTSVAQPITTPTTSGVDYTNTTTPIPEAPSATVGTGVIAGSVAGGLLLVGATVFFFFRKVTLDKDKQATLP